MVLFVRSVCSLKSVGQMRALAVNRDRGREDVKREMESFHEPRSLIKDEQDVKTLKPPSRDIMLCKWTFPTEDKDTGGTMRNVLTSIGNY